MTYSTTGLTLMTCSTTGLVLMTYSTTAPTLMTYSTTGLSVMTYSTTGLALCCSLKSYFIVVYCRKHRCIFLEGWKNVYFPSVSPPNSPQGQCYC